MSQTIPLLKKDLRALWLPLALLYALLIVQSLLALQDQLVRDDVLRFHLLPFVLLLSIIVTAAMLVQQEPLVGTTEFWLTRPIRRGALVAEKALFLLGFVVTPPMGAAVGALKVFGFESHRLPLALLAVLMQVSRACTRPDYVSPTFARVTLPSIRTSCRRV